MIRLAELQYGGSLFSEDFDGNLRQWLDSNPTLQVICKRGPSALHQI
jgi:hypothetical protein